MADRILVYGVTGSGKTTLAGRISGATGVPWYAVDELTWEQGWVEVPVQEQERRIARICAADRWILDTAYSKWSAIPLGRAELIVALDYPRWVSFGRLLRRTAVRIVGRRPICNGNVETLHGALGSESILRWHFRSFAAKRQRIRDWERRAAVDPSFPRVVRLTSPRATRQWLACGCPGGTS